MVAKSDNSETFVGLCLLTVAGASLLTQRLGFSDTLGAFAAGVLLSESNFKTQVRRLPCESPSFPPRASRADCFGAC